MSAVATLAGVDLGMIAPLQRKPEFTVVEEGMSNGKHGVFPNSSYAWSIVIAGQVESIATINELLALIGQYCPFIYISEVESFTLDDMVIRSWDKLQEVEGCPGVWEYQITLCQDTR
jgi:hypothetical protein